MMLVRPRLSRALESAPDPNYELSRINLAIRIFKSNKDRVVKQSMHNSLIV
jgi:hypothetical protein